MIAKEVQMTRKWIKSLCYLSFEVLNLLDPSQALSGKWHNKLQIIGNELLQSYLSLLFPTNSSCYQSCIIGAIYFYRYTRPTSQVASPLARKPFDDDRTPPASNHVLDRSRGCLNWSSSISAGLRNEDSRVSRLDGYSRCFTFAIESRQEPQRRIEARSIRITQVLVRVANRNPFLARGWMLIILRFASGLVLRDIIVALRFVIN